MMGGKRAPLSIDTVGAKKIAKDAKVKRSVLYRFLSKIGWPDVGVGKAKKRRGKKGKEIKSAPRTPGLTEAQSTTDAAKARRKKYWEEIDKKAAKGKKKKKSSFNEAFGE